MPKIETIILRCVSPATQIDFYCKILSMTAFDDGSVGYPGANAHLRFVQADKPYQDRPDSLYWKIAIAVPDIELAVKQLAHKGVSINAPYQFQDIGYLAHFTDPEGFTIELIDHEFRGRRGPTDLDDNSLGGGPHINLLTLRTDHIHGVEAACLELGMKALSVQKVEPDRFSLYFHAFTDDVPPSTDLRSVENRPWLYQRPYTVLEIQHYHKPLLITPADIDKAGYAGVTFTGIENLRLSGMAKKNLERLRVEILPGDEYVA